MTLREAPNESSRKYEETHLSERQTIGNCEWTVFPRNNSSFRNLAKRRKFSRANEFSREGIQMIEGSTALFVWFFFLSYSTEWGLVGLLSVPIFLKLSLERRRQSFSLPHCVERNIKIHFIIGAPFEVEGKSKFHYDRRNFENETNSEYFWYR